MFKYPIFIVEKKEQWQYEELCWGEKGTAVSWTAQGHHVL